MSVTWDKCTVNITNSTGSPMTYSSNSTSEGGIDTPGNIAAGGTGSFDGYSNWDDAANGCAGVVTFSLNDGTLFLVNYKTSYYYGGADDSKYSAGFQGALANRYKATVSDSSSSSNGGAGKRVTVSVTAAKA